MKKLILLFAVILLATFSFSQENMTYQKPPKEILDLVDILIEYNVIERDH